VAFSLAAVACGEADEGRASVDETLSGSPPLAVNMKTRDAQGRVWRVTKKVERLASPSRVLPPESALAEKETLAEMSVEQIAEALRPVMYADGFELTLDEPDLENGRARQGWVRAPGVRRATAGPKFASWRAGASRATAADSGHWLGRTLDSAQ
jgi:hypothetical protein